MLDWFKAFFRAKGTAEAEEEARARAARRARRHARKDFNARTEPMPLMPVVVDEGNSQEAWSAWEDSMNSQLDSLHPSQTVYERDSESRYTRPGPLPEEERDIFGNVQKNRDI
ncbi:hypothetical protein [Ramlibacter sp. PS4R-6]|uniref:hypothetical protein n=1 Tax=Ramlibacter sp. PS4R-6 TaxID=3133438 RepID=UPI0030A58276